VSPEGLKEFDLESEIVSTAAVQECVTRAGGRSFGRVLSSGMGQARGEEKRKEKSE
jgi:hypothetical protein